MSELIPPVSELDEWILDDEGDIMLVVGRSEPCRIRVSSKILSLASNVFKAMFGPHYREGLSLRSAVNPTAEPIIITLSEDDPTAMLSLCQLLHYQIDMVDPRPDVTTLLALATICDKYNCAGAIRYASHIWLNLLVDSAGVGGLNHILIASYLFDCAVMFTKVTSKLLKEWTGPFKELVRDLEGTNIPASIYVALEDQRSKFHFEVQRSLQEMIADAVSGRCTHGSGFNSATHIGTCVTTFVQTGIWPMSRMPNITNTLEQLNAFEYRPIHNACGYTNCSMNFKAKVVKIREDVLRHIQGLCIDCIHQDGYNPGVCRAAHNKEDVNSLTLKVQDGCHLDS